MMRFQYFPDMKGNPYQRLYAAALAKRGVELEPGKRINDQLLIDHRHEIDGVHFHWLEGLIDAPSMAAKLRRVVGLYNYCRCARRIGVRVIWTVHNHHQHEGGSWVDQLGHLVVARNADLIITHSRWSARWVRRWYRPRGRVVAMAHGNYDGCYEPSQTPQQTRDEYNLSHDKPVVGMVGAVRWYRGQDQAIEAALRLAGRVQLLIAGWSRDPAYEAKIQALAQRSDDTVIRPEGLGSANYANAIQACDAILLPYHRVTGSGALMSAWSLGRPVVAYDLPFFAEFIDEGSRAGLLVKTGRVDALAKGIEAILKIPKSEREQAATAEADRYPWDKVVEPVMEVIDQWR